MVSALPERPDMPGYGINPDPQGLLEWSEISNRLAESHNYWVSTTRPDGRPHAAPVWGLWFEGGFYFSTGEQSQKYKNLDQQPHVIVHLESGDEVVILEGVIERVTEAGLLSRLNQAYNQKYGLDIVQDVDTGFALCLHPERAMAWHESTFPDSATRWRF